MKHLLGHWRPLVVTAFLVGLLGADAPKSRLAQEAIAKHEAHMRLIEQHHKEAVDMEAKMFVEDMKAAQAVAMRAGNLSESNAIEAMGKFQPSASPDRKRLVGTYAWVEKDVPPGMLEFRDDGFLIPNNAIPNPKHSWRIQNGLVITTWTNGLRIYAINPDGSLTGTLAPKGDPVFTRLERLP